MDQPKARVIDTFSFNGDPIIELRLAYLYDVVDEFIIVEARETHSGLPKEKMYLDLFHDILKPFEKKITKLVIDRFDQTDSWSRERYQRYHAIKHLVTNQQKYGPDDIIIVSDVDEIPSIASIHTINTMLQSSNRQLLNQSIHLEMIFFYYNLHWLKRMKWYHPYVISFRTIVERYLDIDKDKDKDLDLKLDTYINDLRVKPSNPFIMQKAGVHCSYFLSRNDIKRKLESFAHRECDQSCHKTDEHLDQCLLNGRDISRRSNDIEDCDYNTEFDTLIEHMDNPSMFRTFHDNVLMVQKREVQ